MSEFQTDGAPGPSRLRQRTRLWIAGARPRTLSAAVVPVAVGAAVAVPHASDHAVSWWRAGAALVVGCALQVGANYANDYADGIRGADDARRVGPMRLVGSGAAAAHQVKRAALLACAVAVAVGTALALVVGLELIVVGILCLLACWGYTSGPKPYGYMGLGEVFVFVFFGLVATAGTAYVLLERVSLFALACGVPVGLWAVAMLVANNLRDIVGDEAVGKRTLAVRLGDRRTRRLYVLVLESSYAAALLISLTGRAAAAAAVGAPLAISAILRVLRGATGRDLIGVLAASARVQLVSGLAMAAGIAVTG